MKKIIVLVATALVLASCGGGSKAPRNLDNACALAREKPAYYTAMKRTERTWGVPVHVLMATIHQESRFVSNAKTPHKFALGIIPLGRQSSAYGYSQVLDSTWDEYRRETRSYGARRNRFADASDFMGWYMSGSSEKLGISTSDARSQYLAYHEGRAGFARGSYASKRWLLDVANKVAARAEMYRQQLRSCGK